jgi:hypothetical protein
VLKSKSGKRPTRKRRQKPNQNWHSCSCTCSFLQSCKKWKQQGGIVAAAVAAGVEVVVVGTGSGGPYAPFGDKACRLSTSTCLTSRICPRAFRCFLCLWNRETTKWYMWYWTSLTSLGRRQAGCGQFASWQNSEIYKYPAQTFSLSSSLAAEKVNEISFKLA